MKDLAELEAFEIISRHVNKLFDEAGDELDLALAKLNGIHIDDVRDSIDEAIDELDRANTSSYVNAVVMLCSRPCKIHFHPTVLR